MAYELKRSEKIQEQIKVGDEIITVSLDVDTVAKEFTARYNEIIRAEINVREAQMSLEDNPAQEALEKAMAAYGGAVVQLFALVFGEKGAEKILTFYEDNYFEMTTEVFPFILDVVTPAINRSIEQQREKMATQYKQKQSGFFGLNRSARRRMGL